MATPAVRALRRHFGHQSRIVGIMRPYLADVLEGTNWLDEQWYFDPRARDPKLGHRNLLRRIRRERLEIIVLMTNSLRPAILSWLGGAGERIGWVRGGRGPLLTGKLFLPKERGKPLPMPMVDYYLRLAETAGCPPQSPRLELATTPADERSADGVFARLGLRTDGRVVTLNCSGAYGGSKLWPVEHFGQLARRIVDETDHDVLVMCGPRERATAERVVELSRSGRAFSMAREPLDLGTAKACIGRGRLMVSTDSGPRHVAAALGKPVVTLYGPMLPIWGENPTVEAANLLLDLDCIGCHRRRCPRGHHRCMRELSVETVFQAMVGFLMKEPATRVA